MTTVSIEIVGIEPYNEEGSDFYGTRLEVMDEGGVNDELGKPSRNLLFTLKDWHRTEKTKGKPEVEDVEEHSFGLPFKKAIELRDFLNFVISRTIPPTD